MGSIELLAFLTFLPLILVVTFLHELGHYIMAFLVGVKIDKVCIGMGPTVFKKTSTKVEYHFKILPIGGFLELNHDSFLEAGWLKRLMVTSAGSLFNLYVGIWILFIVMKMSTDTIGPALFNTTLSLALSLITVKFGSVSQLHELAPALHANLLVIPFFILGILSFYIAIFNLLPLPSLDGGRIVFLLLEKISRKPLAFEESIHSFGFWIILTYYGTLLFLRMLIKLGLEFPYSHLL